MHGPGISCFIVDHLLEKKMEIGIFVYVTIAGVFYVLVEYITIGRDIYVSKA